MAQTGFLGALGVLLVVFGLLLLVIKTIVFGGAALVALAIALAVAHFIGAAGKWALWLAGVLALLALPYLVFKALGLAFGIIGLVVALVFKLLPAVLLVFGAYLVLKAVSRR